MLSLFLVCALFQEPARPSTDPAAVLRAADEAFFRTTRARGLEGWLSVFAAEACVFPPQGEILSGAAALRTYYTKLAFPPAGFVWEPDAAGLAPSGDLGWTAGRWGSDLGGTPRWQGRYLTVWRKSATGWEVVADCGGEPDFAQHAPGLAGAPVTLGRERTHSFRASDGSLEATLGGWWASDEAGGECGGKFLSVWRRQEGGGFELASEIGFAQARR